MTAKVPSLQAVNPAPPLTGAVVLLNQLKVQLLSNSNLQMNTMTTVNKIWVTVLPKLHHKPIVLAAKRLLAYPTRLLNFVALTFGQSHRWVTKCTWIPSFETNCFGVELGTVHMTIILGMYFQKSWSVRPEHHHPVHPRPVLWQRRDLPSPPFSHLTGSRTCV